MNIKLLSLFFCVPFFINAQKLTFNYDISGNQSIRELCLVNCTNTNKSANQILKDVDTLADDDLQKFSPEDVISYYPNPVKEELYLKWQIFDQKYVSAIQIYNINGQILDSYVNIKTINNQNLSFNRYPTGVYIVILIYSNGDQETIKIIKQ